MLHGHEPQRAAFEAALAGGRMHHAWLLAGPRGIGKRRFAEWAALTMLGPEAAPLIASRAHPDFRRLEPPEEGKGSATASIVIDQVREIGDFLHSHTALGQRRILIVDSIDDMNLNAANAFLKELEEPRTGTVFLLVSHAPGRLLPTLRSRCRRLRFKPLADADVHAVLAEIAPDASSAELGSLVRLADGAPGAVAEARQADIAGLEAALERAGDAAVAVGIARSMQPLMAVPRLEALGRLIGQRIAAAARRRPAPELFALYEAAVGWQRDGVRLAYDRGQVAMALLDIMARAGRIERGDRQA